MSGRISSVRSSCKPLGKGINAFIGFFKKTLIPRSTQTLMEECGIDNLVLLLVFLTLISVVVYWMVRLCSTSSGNRRRIDLYQFSKVFQDKKALEVENEQLRKREVEIQEVGATNREEFKEIQIAKEKAEDKALRLKQEMSSLQHNNEFLEKELKKDREEMKSLKERTEAAKERREKLHKESEALKSENDTLSAQLKEFRGTCESSRENSVKLEKELDEKTRELKEKGRNLKNLEVSEQELRKESQETAKEAEDLKKLNADLEIELSGLKAIVENLNLPPGGGVNPTDSAGSGNGWEDIGGGKEDEEKRRLQLAELKNVAQLHAKIKQTKDELERSKSVCQKETDLRVSLDSQLKLAQEDVGKMRDKLDLADTERRDLLTQVKKMTEMVASKDKEVQSRVEELNKKLERVREENERLHTDFSHQKSEKEVLDEKYRDMTEAYSRVKRELDRTETQSYHEMREKDTQMRQMKVEMMQLRMNIPKRPDSAGVPASPGAINASSHSSEAEIAQINADISGASGGGFPVDDIWTLPPASRPPRFFEEPYDSPPSSLDYNQQEGGGRRRHKSKTRGSPSNRRRTLDPGLMDSGEEAGQNLPKDRRSRSRGGGSAKEQERSRSPEHTESNKNAKSKRRAKSKGRSPMDYNPYGPGPSPMYPPPHPGFDPYYGPPPPGYYGRGGHYYSSGGSATGGRSPPPPQMPLVGGLPPPGVKEVKPISGKPRPKSSTGAKMS